MKGVNGWLTSIVKITANSAAPALATCALGSAFGVAASFMATLRGRANAESAEIRRGESATPAAGFVRFVHARGADAIYKTNLPAEC